MGMNEMKTFQCKQAYKGLLSIKAMRGYDEWDPRSNIVDVVANLFHYAALRKIDMEDCIRMAREHYQAESKQ